MTSRKKAKRKGRINNGAKLEANLFPDGPGLAGAAARTGRIQDFFGVLAGKTKKVATIEEINEAAAAGWAGLVVDN